MDWLEFYKERYYKEIERRGQFNDRFSILLTIVTVSGGGYLLIIDKLFKVLESNNYEINIITYVIMAMSIVIFILYAIIFYNMYYVYYENKYEQLRSSRDIEEKRKTIDTEKQKLENQKNELAVIVESQTKTTRTLQNTKKLRESFLERLSDQEQETQQQIDEYNKQYEEINRQIIALVANGIDSNYIGGTLAWPVPGYTKITSEYAMRVHPITGVYKLHTGVDISAPMGANFISANDGIVVKAEMNSAYGNMVIIDHGGGISTLYAHGSEILVTVGQSVKRGDAILKVGSTGYSTGPHAHFEVRINGVTTNPLPYITNGLVPGEENTSNQNTTNQNITN